MTASIPLGKGATDARRAPVWVPAAASFAVLSIGYLPVALVGVMALPLATSIGSGAVGIGGAIAVFWIGNALTAPLVGHWADRNGWVAVSVGGVVCAMLGLLGIGALANSTTELILGMFLAGIAMAMCSQSSNLVIAREVTRGRQGAAFGFKQTAPPMMAMASGALLVLVGIPFGWRRAFDVAALFSVPAVAAVLVLCRMRRHGHAPDAIADGADESVPPAAAMVLIGGGVAFASIAIAALGAFSVPTLVSTGIEAQHAAFLFSGASLVAVVSRLATGRLSDRVGHRSLVRAAAMIGLSAAGLGLLAMPSPAAAIAGLFIAVTMGWGWPTTLLPVVMRFWTQSAARTTGLVAIGSSTGAAAGPVLFAMLASRSSWSAAWLAASILSVGAVAMLLVAQRLLLGHGPLTVRPPAVDLRP